MNRDLLERLLRRASQLDGPVVFLTGAGISRESGIPTFRGPEGYWQVGSRNYQPMELATLREFQRQPDVVWGWYLYRRAVCRRAAPNAAHHALAKLEAALGDRMLLITQNVDGLHLRAGNSPGRTFQIHGNIDTMRCALGCTAALVPVPTDLAIEPRPGQVLQAAERELLVCAECGGPMRPHVLWFDECYDEAHFHFDSSRAAACRAALLVVIGTSGATNLPTQICVEVARRGAPVVVVDPEPTPFTQLAEQTGGLFIRGNASVEVPSLVGACDQEWGLGL